MGAAGIGFHLQPGEVLRGGIDDTVIGNGVIGPLLAMLGDTHAVAIHGLFLDQPGRNLVLVLARNAFDQRPIGLLGVALAEGGRQLLRSTAGAGNHQHAGGIAVETVHQTRLFRPSGWSGFQKPVDMAVDAGTALNGNAGRLVENENLVVFMQEHARQKFRVFRMFEIP